MTQNQRKQIKQHPATQKLKQDLGLLRFKADGSQVTLQHHVVASTCDSNGATKHQVVPTLRIDLKSGKVWVGTAGPLPEDSPLTLGIIGLLRLERGSILALISKAKRVCALLDGPVYKVEDTTLVAPEAINACENDLRHASLFQEAFNPKCFGSHLYFSHTANITASRQRQADMNPGLPDALPTTSLTATAASSNRDSSNGGGAMPTLGAWWRSDEGAGGGQQGAAPAAAAHARGGRGGRGGSGTLWSQSDPRFVWNREMMRPLIDAGAESFALPLMTGYIGQATGATFIPRSPTEPTPSSSRPPQSDGCTTAKKTKENESETATDCGGKGDTRGLKRGDKSNSISHPGQQTPDSAVCGAVVGSNDDDDANCPGELTLITRLGVERPVAGGWRRGVDRHGHTAGFAETEVMLSLWAPQESEEVPQGAPSGAQDGQLPADSGTGRQEDGGEGAVAVSGPLRRRTKVAVASYTMVRGSAPLHWSAPPDMTPCPQPRGPEDPAAHTKPFRRHMDALTEVYGKPLLLLNLISGANRGAQLRLHDTLQKQLSLYKASKPPSAMSTTAAATPATASASAATSETDVNPRLQPGAPHGAAVSGDVAVVGLVLEGSDLAQLAACGAAAARVEEQCRPETRRMGAFLSVEELEMTFGDNSGTGPAAAAGGDAGGGGGSSGGRTCGRGLTVTSRSVLCRQRGVVRVSSGSTGSAGGCCEEVDLVQYALSLPALAEALVAVGAMQDVADMERAHASVMLALSQLWSNMADVLADQALGTDSSAGRLLRSAAAGMEQSGSGIRGLVTWAVRSPWRAIVVLGDATSRYYYANFTDARRQDALDLACGAYKVSQPPALMPRRQPPSTTSLQLGLLLLGVAILQVFMCAMGGGLDLGDFGMRVGGPAAIGTMLLYDIMRRGVSYVEQPLALPKSVYPWSD